MELIYDKCYIRRDGKRGFVILKNITDAGCITCVNQHGKEIIICSTDFYALYKEY